MNFPAHRIFSFFWFPSEVITPRRSIYREAGFGMVWNLGIFISSGTPRVETRILSPLLPLFCGFSSVFLVSDTSNPHRPSVGCSAPQFSPFAPFSAPTLPSVSVNEIFFLTFPPFSFSLMNGCPGDSCSWPCLHQVRGISFYFVFHQLWLHKTPLVSGDCCQQLQSPLLVGSFACVPPPTLCVHLPADSHLMKQEVSGVPGGMLLTLLPVAFVALASCSSLGLIPSCVNQVGCDSMLDFIVEILLL